MAGRRRGVAIAAAAGAGIAGAVLGLSDSLFSQLAAGAVLALAVAFPSATIGRSRALAGAGALLLVAAALAAHLVAGRFAPLCELGGDGARLSALAAIVIAAAAIWALARRPLAAERASPVAPLCALAAAAAIGIGGALADPEGSCTAPTRAVEPYAGVLHGRGELWEAAWEAGLERPLAGAGADSYVFATAALQEGGNALYAHDLPLELFAELGILGLAAAIALYVAVGATLLRARRSPALWLAGPAVAGFMLANLIDFPWHLAGAGAIWALALGALIAAGYRSEPANG